MAKQGRVTVPLAHDWHIPAGGTDEPPLEATRHEDRRIGEKVQPWLDREEHQQGELVKPVQVIGDDDVVAAARPRNVLTTPDVEAEAQPQQRDPEHAHEAVSEVGARTYG